MNIRLCLVLTAMLCSSPSIFAQSRARFEPPEGRRLLILGQDLGAIGGFPAPNNDGYTNHVPLLPAGVTTYTSLASLDGLKSSVNLWSGDLCAQCILDNPAYANAVLAIGLNMVGHEEKTARGELDDKIRALGSWIKASGRPVFLRIGYEFDGSWNRYQPSAYQKAFQRIVTLFRELGVTNCAAVWQAATSPFNQQKDIAAWYPGDEFVDWIGYSWFLTSPKQVELTDQLLAFARAHQKPVMACEAAPQGYDLARLTRRNIAASLDGPAGQGSRPKSPEEIWQEWFQPFFDYVDKNREQIRIVAYINVNWDSQPMWGPPYRQGYWGDSRIESNPVLQKKWLETVSERSWLPGSATLFKELGF